MHCSRLLAALAFSLPAFFVEQLRNLTVELPALSLIEMPCSPFNPGYWMFERIDSFFKQDSLFLKSFEAF